VFVVGCSRSGTTLLRLMLDGHPSLAVPDESHFIVSVHRSHAARRDPQLALHRALRHERFLRWGLDRSLVCELAAVAPPRSYSEAMALIFAAYAQREGKPRWGDKTPPYATKLPLLSALFPTAQFIHLIRDGREVAASLFAHRWGPTTPIACASYWRAQVGAARRDGLALGPERYQEVRLEQLIAEPERVLREICKFIGEPYSPLMLGYQSRTGRVWSDEVDHRHLALPPTAGLRNWRAGLRASDALALEAAAQPLLSQLGYAQQRPVSPRTRLWMRADVVRRVPRIVAREAWTHGVAMRRKVTGALRRRA